MFTFGSIVIEAVARVQEQLDRLWASPPHRPHVFHGDLGPHNVLMYRGRARPIDFQDLQIGFDLQDVAITVADLRRTAPGGIEPFRAGYTDVQTEMSSTWMGYGWARFAPSAQPSGESNCA